MNCTAWNSVVAKALTSRPRDIPSVAFPTASAPMAQRGPETSRPRRPKASEQTTVAWTTATSANATRHRHQPLKRSRCPLPQHCHRRDDEHRDEREQSQEWRTDLLEDQRPTQKDFFQQRLEQAGDADDEQDRARVTPELREDTLRGRHGRVQAHVSGSTSRRNTSSMPLAPVLSRSCAGVPAAISFPSRKERLVATLGLVHHVA